VIAPHAGVVDTVALVGHMNEDGAGRFNDLGSCEMPATRPGS